MYDEDVSDIEWAALRRAVSALFLVRYGVKPRITHSREKPRVGIANEDRYHRISLTAPATGLRNAVVGSIGCRHRVSCYLYLIEELHEKLDTHHYDGGDADEWIIETTRGVSNG